MKSRMTCVAVSAGAVLLTCRLASAHPGSVGHLHSDGGLGGGMMHPFTGIDHILAMIAIGVLAAQAGRRAIWLLPATFVALMLAGGALALNGIRVPFVEQGIVASVVVLGVLIAIAGRLPLSATLPIVGLFAVFHGYAHVSEMNSPQAPMQYAIGFVLATVLLHATGITLGLSGRRLASASIVRLGGAAIAGCGVLMFAGMI